MNTCKAPLNIILSSLHCNTWPSNDCTTDKAHYQVINNISYTKNNPLNAFGSIVCNRALTSNRQLDISGVATGADPATGKLNGQYPDQAKSDEWQCEQFVSSVSGDLSKCQPVT